MQLTRLMVPTSKYSIKCPYTMEPDGICVHNTANKASAMAEISYMVGNNYEVSFHYAIDDYRIVQGVEENRNTWHAGDGNGPGNRRKISIEICYSTAEDESLFTKSELLAAKFIAYKLKERGWGIDRVSKHQDYSGKYCPHKTLDWGWERFLNLIRKELGEEVTLENNTATTQTQTSTKIDVKYQVYAGKWYPDIVNYNEVDENGYAGVYGQAISGFRGNTVGQEAAAGKLIYRVHTKNGSWLGEITDREKEASSGDDFAGILGRAIDGIVIRATKGTARYRVHLLNGSWLPWVTGYNTADSNNGYAGILGEEIDAIQAEIA